MLFPADNDILVSTDFMFQWQKDNRSSYYFLLQDVNSSENDWMCLIKQIKDTFLSSKSANCPSLKNLKIGNVYSWTIAPLNSKNSYFINFSFASKNKLDSIAEKFNEFKNESLDDEVRIILEAALYQKYKLYSEANKKYLLALTQFPNSEFCKESYQKFITFIKSNNERH
ncbi:MAG: hypothetical protein IPJ79_01275 [Bacteroidetes bacterium]|nr:hypothetical protein [Bacteroidota bacterium]